MNDGRWRQILWAMSSPWVWVENTNWRCTPTFTDQIFLRRFSQVSLTIFFIHDGLVIYMQPSQKIRKTASCKSIAQDCKQVLLIFVSETRENRSRKYLVSVSWVTRSAKDITVAKSFLIFSVHCPRSFSQQVETRLSKPLGNYVTDLAGCLVLICGSEPEAWGPQSRPGAWSQQWRCHLFCKTNVIFVLSKLFKLANNLVSKECYFECSLTPLFVHTTCYLSAVNPNHFPNHPLFKVRHPAAINTSSGQCYKPIRTVK